MLLGKEVENEDDDDVDDEDDDNLRSEQNVILGQVPAAVRATILREAGEHKIEEIEKETRNGRAVYEAEWQVGGKEIEITVAPDGELLGREVEEDDDD